MSRALILLLPHFTNKETEVQGVTKLVRGGAQVAASRSHALKTTTYPG